MPKNIGANAKMKEKIKQLEYFIEGIKQEWIETIISESTTEYHRGFNEAGHLAIKDLNRIIKKIMEISK